MQISASINTALLEASRADLFVCCLACFYAAAAELSGCDGAYVALKPKLFTTWPFTETVYPPAPPHPVFTNSHSQPYSGSPSLSCLFPSPSPYRPPYGHGGAEGRWLCGVTGCLQG